MVAIGKLAGDNTVNFLQVKDIGKLLLLTPRRVIRAAHCSEAESQVNAGTNIVGFFLLAKQD